MYPSINGSGNGSTTTTVDEPKNEQAAEAALIGPPLTLGYKPSMPVTQFFTRSNAQNIAVLWQRVEEMLCHPHVSLPYGYYKSGIAHAVFEVECDQPKVKEFIQAQVERFWERSLDQVQNVYDYGWLGAEASYRLEKGLLCFDGLSSFYPLDASVLTFQQRYRGIRVQNVEGSQGKITLWGPRKWPAKGVWFTHNRRFHRWYGRSQLLGALRPYLRLADRDGAEEVVDGGVFRFAYRGPEIRYPPEDFKRKDNGSPDPNAARNAAREFGEQAKAGASYGLPNTRDAKGEYKWAVNWPTSTLNVSGLLDYNKALKDEISYGIGVPPELIEASETGSGWSGRKVPLIGFYVGQLRNARSILWAFKSQFGDPLVRWNFGPNIMYDIKVKLKIPDDLAGGDEQGQGEAGAPGDSAPGGVQQKGDLQLVATEPGKPRRWQHVTGKSLSTTDIGEPEGIDVASVYDSVRRAIQQRSRERTGFMMATELPGERGDEKPAEPVAVTPPQIIVNVPEQPAPIVHVHIPTQAAPIVNVTPPQVSVQMPVAKPTRKRVVRSRSGVIEAIVEEPEA